MKPEEKQELRNLRKEVESLKRSSTIPSEVESALNERFGFADFAKVENSAKASTTERKQVSEGGAATYYVQDVCDGFVEHTLSDNTLIYIPYYT